MPAATDPASAYDALASAYDVLTAGYCHDRWLERLERLALDHGLRGNRLLDVACGTGKSFLPMLERGYRVTACDISERMLALAAAKAPQAELLHADMRSLGALGAFDLVTCLDDALNHLLTEGELHDALSGFRRNLAPAGLAVWDLNTLAMYRSAFAGDWITERDGCYVAWRGRASRTTAAGAVAEVAIDVFAADDPGWRRATSVHRQRHWPAATVEAIARAAGLRLLSVHGQHRGARLEPWLDELAHTKMVFLACRGEGVRA
jgi:SAM-dependent methyltransferase